MLPLNYAILKQFLTDEAADVGSIMRALEPEYSKFRAFRRKAVVEALMTAEANGLIEEIHYSENETGEIIVSYRATEYGREMIEKYIGGA